MTMASAADQARGEGERSTRWASTMSGFNPDTGDDAGGRAAPGLRVAHADSRAELGAPPGAVS